MKNIILGFIIIAGNLAFAEHKSQSNTLSEENSKILENILGDYEAISSCNFGDHRKHRFSSGDDVNISLNDGFSGNANFLIFRASSEFKTSV